ncbi:LysR family transcriptional regulator [Clostridium sp. MCC353]|uniref:LysR family transcriptional regulator n=1 Tax=Clostridium sp. MCC353 TaxID=2592646 RepID=UPI001C00B775|nr:LysR family transcriptional regulator [Clostridium sp. MCC353]MBT9778715.1 LysR family transcriptional regulator [Clostridium sp. MCC353]
MKRGIMDYMIALQECRMISSAADRCNISQSSLSGYLKRLEEELGVTLYDRKSKEMTPEGNIYADTARAILAEDESVRQKLRKFQPHTVRFGVDEYIDRKTVSQLVTELFMIHPEITIQLVSAPCSTLHTSLLDGSVDLAFASFFSSSSSRLRYQEYMKEALLLALPKGYPLHNAQIPLQALRTLKLITLYKRTQLYSLQTALLSHSSLDPVIMFETNSPALAASMISCGGCASIIPASSAFLFNNCDLYPISSAYLNSGLWYLKEQHSFPIQTDLRKLLVKVLHEKYADSEYIHLTGIKCV